MASIASALGDPAPSVHAGLCYLKQGDKENAAALFDAALEFGQADNSVHQGYRERVKAVGMETRQVATKTGLETLKAKAAEREEANQKKIEETQKQLEKLREQEKLSPFMKALKWIGMALGAIAAVATAAIGAMTANPLLIVGAAIMLTMTVNSIVSEATDGKYSISAGVAELAKQCGASEETAQWIGMGVEIGISDLAPDEEASCMLEIDDQLFNLQWFEESRALAVYAVVGAAEHGPRALLEANALGRDTGGRALGLHAGLDSLLLSGQVFVGDLEGDDVLYRYVEFFADQAKHWEARIREILAETPETPGASDGAGHGLRV
jgi:tetratricopeptide (TPR) repeat protein